MDTLGFIGVGHMASAILDTILEKRLLPAQNILLFDINPAQMDRYLAQGMRAAASSLELAEQSVIVVLAVKPQVLGDVLDEIAPVSAEGRFISIAAGVTSAYIRQRLDASAFVARVMPNAPLTLAAGATVIAQDDTLPPEMARFVERMFSSMGTVAFLPEDKLNEVIGVSGSSPAFFFRLAHVMARTAEEQGIPYETALDLIAQTMAGSAQMLKRDKNPEALISMVASPGGTTEAAMQSLDRDVFDLTIRNAMLWCTERAYELGKDE